MVIVDGAPCHNKGGLEIPRNITLVTLPPYSPQLNPSENNWVIWKENLTNHDIDFLQDNQKICFTNHELNYGTRSSSLIAIPNAKEINKKTIFISTPGFPTKNNYADVIT